MVRLISEGQEELPQSLFGRVKPAHDPMCMVSVLISKCKTLGSVEVEDVPAMFSDIGKIAEYTDVEFWSVLVVDRLKMVCFGKLVNVRCYSLANELFRSRRSEMFRYSSSQVHLNDIFSVARAQHCRREIQR